MPYTVRLSVWGTVSADLVSDLKVAIATELGRKTYRAQDNGSVVLGQRTYRFAVDRFDRPNKLVYVTVFDPRRP